MLSAEERTRAEEACKAITRENGRSFYFASFVLPRARRLAAYAVYAFCRSADDAIDEGAHVGESELQFRLEGLRQRLDAIFAGRPSGFLADAILEDAVPRYGIERRPFDELLEGMRIDLGTPRFQTTAQLLDYAHKVAGTVGQMMLPILGGGSPEARARADELGIAMQLTNILRDVGEDLQLGRIYLAEEELAPFDLSHKDVEQRVADERWRAFMQSQIARARDYYARAGRGIPLITTRGGRVCTRLMSLIYGDILRVIEARGFDSFSGRARVSFGRKLQLLGRGVFLPSSATWPALLAPSKPGAR